MLDPIMNDLFEGFVVVEDCTTTLGTTKKMLSLRDMVKNQIRNE
jgi:hypothetical protein